MDNEIQEFNIKIICLQSAHKFPELQLLSLITVSTALFPPVCTLSVPQQSLIMYSSLYICFHPHPSNFLNSQSISSSLYCYTVLHFSFIT